LTTTFVWSQRFYLPEICDQLKKYCNEDDGGDKAEKLPVDDYISSILEIISINSDGIDKMWAPDAMNCLNMLGIIWSGRGRTKLAIIFLLTSKSYYEVVKRVEIHRDESWIVELESSMTHCLFYLAQAYGLLGDSKSSSLYCRQVIFYPLYRQQNS